MAFIFIYYFTVYDSYYCFAVVYIYFLIDGIYQAF